LAFSLVHNHAFLDGNKRTGYVAMRTFLILNGYELAGRSEEKEQVILAVASGSLDREQFAAWVRVHSYPIPNQIVEGEGM